MTDGPATRADLFDAVESLRDDLEEVLLPDFVGGYVIVSPATSTDYASVFDHPVKCIGCCGGAIGLQEGSGVVRWYPLSRLAWVQVVTDDVAGKSPDPG